MIRHDEPWMQIASLDAQNHIFFTDEFREMMGALGWEAKAFVGHLLGLWADPFEHMLDYTSREAKVTADQPGLKWDSNRPLVNPQTRRDCRPGLSYAPWLALFSVQAR